MGILYIDTGGATTNSGSTDAAAADITLTINAGEAFGDATLLVDVNTGALTSIVTSGASQSTIRFGDATNTNKKVFWISAYDNAASPKTITVDTTPTGLTAGTSTGTIGGQLIFAAADIESAVRAGDIVQFNNTPAAKATDFFTARVAGTSAGGRITLRGKIGVRPVLNVTNTNQCLDNISQVDLWHIENLELDQDGASGSVCGEFGDGTVFTNIKIVDGGGVGLSQNANAQSILIYNSQITGTGSDAGAFNGDLKSVGNYIHDITGKGLACQGIGFRYTVLNTIIDTCSAQGIHFSPANTSNLGNLLIDGCTIYGCGDSGLEIADADSLVQITNTIFSENGNAAGEYNIEYVAGSDVNGFHAGNIFYHSGTGGGANLSGVTTNSTEFTTDPLFTNAAGGDFSLTSSSPGKATGYPAAFLGANTNYRDIGAVQRQEAAGGEKCSVSTS